MRMRAVVVGGLLGLLARSLPAQQPAEDEATKLAKATQNPIADLVSLPFQFNFNNGGGLDDETLFVLNFQPVVTVKSLLRHRGRNGIDQAATPSASCTMK
jgi:hypothetical protein